MARKCSCKDQMDYFLYRKKIDERETNDFRVYTA
jgi:hypothetical protein